MSVIIGLAVAVALSSTSLPAGGSAPECSAAGYLAGACVEEIGDDSITIGAALVDGESTATAPVGPVSEPGAAAAAPERCVEVDMLDRCDFTVSVADEPTAGTAAAPITIADLASFTPAVGELIVQPENWGVRGIPTNFAATATDHIQQGTLLGRPIEVRWRPIAFTFDYGDDTQVTTNHAGSTWQTTDDDWTTTSTSHEYPDRGEYTATVTITFEADIATDTGWTTVPGTLQLAPPTENVQIFDVRTALTRGDCIDYPNDPGCSP